VQEFLRNPHNDPLVLHLLLRRLVASTAILFKASPDQFEELCEIYFRKQGAVTSYITKQGLKDEKEQHSVEPARTEEPCDS